MKQITVAWFSAGVSSAVATKLIAESLDHIIGGTCISGTFLDELDPEAGRDVGPVVAECGPQCEMTLFEGARR